MTTSATSAAAMAAQAAGRTSASTAPSGRSWTREGRPRSVRTAPLEVHERLTHEPPRRNNVSSSKGRQDVVKALDVEGVQDHELQLKGNRDLVEVVADLEVHDRPRFDAIRVESRSCMVGVDERDGKRIIGVVGDVGRSDAGHEPGVVADIRAEPEARVQDVVVQRALDLKLLVMVDEKRTAGDGVEGSRVEKEPAREGRHVFRMDVAGGNESMEAVGRREVEPEVPAVVVAFRKREREHDAGVEELVLVAGV